LINKREKYFKKRIDDKKKHYLNYIYPKKNLRENLRVDTRYKSEMRLTRNYA